MHLPPLTHPQDDAFLRKMTAIVIDAFWSNYIGGLSESVQQELTTALDAEDAEALFAWYKQYANFAADADAEERGRGILVAISHKLLPVLQHEYNLFTEDDAVAL